MLALAGESTDAGEPLYGAVGEVRNLRRAYRHVTALALPSDSSLYNPTLLGSARVLHIASHLSLDDQNPWQSALILGGDSREHWLRADEIAELDLNARLAVLAGCESAASK